MSNGATSHISYLDVDRKYKGPLSFLNWLWSIDHKRIGVMYLYTAFLFFLVAVGIGVCIKLEKMYPGQQYFDPDTYNRLFTTHSVIMIFLFIIPALPSIFGNFFLPLMIGAKDVSFPRINLLSYWVYLLGALIALSGLFFHIPEGHWIGGANTGWTFTPPYSTQEGAAAVSTTLLAAFILGWGTILTGINFIVTIHRMRAPGLTWFKLPLFVWASYATSWITVLATPVVGITLMLQVLERFMPIGWFDPAKGGDPILFQHMFWIYSHPAVYVMILPAMGAVTEIIAVFSQRTIFGYKAIAFSSIGIAAVGYFVWAHHMFLVGMSETAQFVFSFFTFLVAIPTAIKVFNWTATLYKGSIKLDPPMLFALAFIFNFSIGGLTGLFLGALSVDVHLHDTDFVVAHFHYTMFGGGGFGLFAAVHYWYPKMFGRMYNMLLAKISFWVLFIGFNTLYIPMFLLGLMGMPRRYHDYVSRPYFDDLQKLSSIGAMILATGVILMLFNWAFHTKRGKKVGDNPWNGKTLEWQTQTPPVLFNFDEIPIVTKGPYDYGDDHEGSDKK
ncbi:MAG: cytochrome c oxidase subunit I [Planctomycetota bacterium]|nr:MAG: cytochrome c oxidase subunit I [Planctomycetota bacterium]